jgi:hypothetical protein
VELGLKSPVIIIRALGWYSYSSTPIYLPFDASPSEHVNILYFTLNYRDFANYRFRKLQISQTADFANYRFRKLQISQITDFANCRFRFVSFRFVSFRFVNYSKPTNIDNELCCYSNQSTKICQG